ncbi:hypothetical protein [Specibacter cremeus]|uniref:hypothetical protein n=1 Tax=Specibacter cremeus TaxID=1629051 RepID=UPI000F77C9E0|nr:hypothetical protein [Specibacter cremeus]
MSLILRAKPQEMIKRWSPACLRPKDMPMNDDASGANLAHDRALDETAAFLADTAILEVALRNALVTRLEVLYGHRWFEVDAGFHGPARDKLQTAWGALPSRQKTPGHLVVRLMFGFWKGLLEPGGYAGRARHSQVGGRPLHAWLDP